MYMSDNIWRTRWNLSSLDYVIIRTEGLTIVSILQSLVALVEKGIGEMRIAEVYTYSLGDDTAFQGDLAEEGRKEAMYEFVERELQDLAYIELNATLHGYDDQGHQVKIKNGIQLDLDVYDDVDYHLLEIKLNTDIFAPFYYEKTSRSYKVAEKNFPLLKGFIEGVGATFEGKWDEVMILPYMYGYFRDHGLQIKEEEE